MEQLRLASGDAFAVIDLEGADASVGPVRCARKVLRDSSSALARSVTYAFASFDVRASGAAAGINAVGEARDAAVAGFVADVAPLAESGRFLPMAAKGVDDADLAPLGGAVAALADARDRLLAPSVATAASAARDLDGASVAIEWFDDLGPAVAQALVARGARVVAVAVGPTTLAAPDGFEIDDLVAARAAGPAGLGEHPQRVETPLAATVADVLVVGSKPGVVDHVLAADVHAGLVVPSGPIPVSARALAVLRRAGTIVLPDFLATAAPLLAAVPAAGAPREDDEVLSTVAGSVGEVLGHEDGPLLGACHRAESFLRSWRGSVPFGRPIG